MLVNTTIERDPTPLKALRMPKCSSIEGLHSRPKWCSSVDGRTTQALPPLFQKSQGIALECARIASRTHSARYALSSKQHEQTTPLVPRKNKPQEQGWSTSHSQSACYGPQKYWPAADREIAVRVPRDTRSHLAHYVRLHAVRGNMEGCWLYSKLTMS